MGNYNNEEGRVKRYLKRAAKLKAEQAAVNWVWKVLCLVGGFFAQTGVALFTAMAPLLVMILMLVGSACFLADLEGVVTGMFAGVLPEGKGGTQAKLSEGEIEKILGEFFPEDGGEVGGGSISGGSGAGSGASDVATRREAVRFGLEHVGYEYSQARRASGEAFDCSSLVWYSFNEAGVDLPGGSAQWPPVAGTLAMEMEKAGMTVKVGEMEPGDIVFWRTSGGIQKKRYMGIGHVAIYVGGGRIVEAMDEKHGVVYGPMRAQGNVVMVGRVRSGK